MLRGCSLLLPGCRPPRPDPYGFIQASKQKAPVIRVAEISRPSNCDWHALP